MLSSNVKRELTGCYICFINLGFDTGIKSVHLYYNALHIIFVMTLCSLVFSVVDIAVHYYPVSLALFSLVFNVIDSVFICILSDVEVYCYLVSLALFSLVLNVIDIVFIGLQCHWHSDHLVFSVIDIEHIVHVYH